MMMMMLLLLLMMMIIIIIIIIINEYNNYCSHRSCIVSNVGYTHRTTEDT